MKEEERRKATEEIEKWKEQNEKQNNLQEGHPLHPIKKKKEKNEIRSWNRGAAKTTSGLRGGVRENGLFGLKANSYSGLPPFDLGWDATLPLSCYPSTILFFNSCSSFPSA